MLEKLQAKRAVLVAQRDQIMANYNLTSGAIAIIDELIGEALADASKVLAEEPKPEVSTAVNVDAQGADPALIEQLTASAAKTARRKSGPTAN